MSNIANPGHKKSQSKKQSKKIIFVLIFAASLFGYYFFVQPKLQHGSAPNMAAMSGAGRIVEVNALIVHQKKISLTQELPARVAAYKISEVRPQINGVIEKQIFTEGSVVKKGQPLYQIDSSIYQASYDDAVANLKAVSAKQKRYKNLLESDAVSKQEYDDMLAVYHKAKADAKKAQTDLARTKIPAPISGHIGKSNVTVGALVTANQTEVLTTITELDPIYVDIPQASKDAMRQGNQKGTVVSLRVDDMTYEEKGALEFSEMFTDTSTDSVILRAKFSNKNGKLIPGMFVNATLNLKAVKAITVPQKATTRMPDGSLVIWVVENEIAKPRVIKTEQNSGDEWVVIEGLSDGEIIITEGFQKVTDGTKIKAMLPEKLPEGSIETVKTAEEKITPSGEKEVAEVVTPEEEKTTLIAEETPIPATEKVATIKEKTAHKKIKAKKKIVKKSAKKKASKKKKINN